MAIMLPLPYPYTKFESAIALPSGRGSSLRFERRFTILCMLLMSSLLSGCANNDVQRPALLENSSAACQSPSGFYANSGRAVGGSQSAPPLSSLLWDGNLAGFNVDRVSLETSADEKLIVNAWRGDTRIDDALEIDPRDRDCDDGRWRFTSRWDGHLLEGVVAGLIWTGGMFLPAAERDEYTLQFTESGELAVRYVGRTTGTVFIFFPMYVEGEETWFIYDRIEESASEFSDPADNR